ncbi:MAG: hypothetical protein JWO33_2077, partial [Caulobacteraceae bacterium]|nr:hypothetical protein [Caulobacteraceae bacterium]
MRRQIACVSAAVFVAVAGAGALQSGLAGAAPQPVSGGELKPVAAFAGIADQKARSAALFTEAGKVLTSPRCLNCHPAGERPSQYDAMTPHQPWVVRGADGHGAPGLRCETCHQESNFDTASVPGAPKWRLAPLEMAWQGKSLGEICRQLEDPKRNGGMDRDKLVAHSADDKLVAWGWAPGVG